MAAKVRRSVPSSSSSSSSKGWEVLLQLYVLPAQRAVAVLSEPLAHALAVEVAVAARVQRELLPVHQRVVADAALHQ